MSVPLRQQVKTAQKAGFNRPSFEGLFDYWSSLRCDGAIPAACDVKPAPMLRFLPDVTILEVVSPNCVQYRLVGTGVTERLGFDPTGKNMFDMIAPDTLDIARLHFQHLVAQPCGSRARHMNINKNGREAIVISLFLPLSTPEGMPSRILSLHMQEEIQGYQSPGQTVAFAASLNFHEWIDIGFGVPESKL